MTTGAYDSLLAFAGGRGHREFPLLSAHYSPGSCIPCRDFSPWLRKRLREGDRDALVEYVWRIRAANPGVGFGNDPRMIARIFAPQVHRIIDAPLERHVIASDSTALEDLRTALLMAAPLDGFSGFTMAGKVPRYVAAVMLPCRVQFARATELRNQADAFVAEMVKDTPFWENWPLPDPMALESLTRQCDQGDESLHSALLPLPVGTRAHAVDASIVAARDTSDAAGQTALALELKTTYVTRQHGCDAEESARALMASGLFVAPVDPSSYLIGLTQRELVELGTLHGVPLKKSWAKVKLAATIATTAPDAALAAMVGHIVGMIAPERLPAVGRALAWLEATAPAWSLVTSFAIPPARAH